MEKPDYHSLIDEAKESASRKMRYPIILVTRIILFALSIYFLIFIFKYLDARNYDFGDIKFILGLLFSLSLILVYFAGEVPLKFHPNKYQITKALKYLLIVREDEYLEEMTDCTDYLTSLNEDLLLTEQELSIAQENFINIDVSYKKDVEASSNALSLIREAIPKAESELKIAQDNVREFSAVKKALEVVYL